MSVIIRLQGLPWSASAMNIRHFFSGLSIPAGGVHIIGGEGGDAFIAFSSDDDARMAMKMNLCPLNGTPVQLYLSSKSEMQSVIDAARSGTAPTNVLSGSSATNTGAPAAPGMGGNSGGHQSSVHNMPGGFTGMQGMNQSNQYGPIGGGFQNMQQRGDMSGGGGGGIGVSGKSEWQPMPGMMGAGTSDGGGQFNSNQRNMMGGDDNANRYPGYPDNRPHMNMQQGTNIMGNQGQMPQGQMPQSHMGMQGLGDRQPLGMDPSGHGDPMGLGRGRFGDDMRAGNMGSNMNTKIGQFGGAEDRNKTAGFMHGQMNMDIDSDPNKQGMSGNMMDVPRNRGMNDPMTRLGFQGAPDSQGSDMMKERLGNQVMPGPPASGSPGLGIGGSIQSSWVGDNTKEGGTFSDKQAPINPDRKGESGDMTHTTSFRRDRPNRVNRFAEVPEPPSQDQFNQPKRSNEPDFERDMRFPSRFHDGPKEQMDNMPSSRGFTERPPGERRGPIGDDGMPSTRYPPDDDDQFQEEGRFPMGRGGPNERRPPPMRYMPDDMRPIGDESRIPPNDRGRFSNDDRGSGPNEGGRYPPHGDRYPDHDRRFPPDQRFMGNDRNFPPSNDRPYPGDDRRPPPGEGRFMPDDRPGMWQGERQRSDDMMARRPGDNPFPPEDPRHRERDQELRRDAFERNRHGAGGEWPPNDHMHGGRMDYQGGQGSEDMGGKPFPPDRRGFSGDRHGGPPFREDERDFYGPPGRMEGRPDGGPPRWNRGDSANMDRHEMGGRGPFPPSNHDGPMGRPDRGPMPNAPQIDNDGPSDMDQRIGHSMYGNRRPGMPPNHGRGEGPPEGELGDGPHDFDNRAMGSRGGGMMMGERPPRGRGDPFNRGRPGTMSMGRGRGMEMDRHFEEGGPPRQDVDNRTMAGDRFAAGPNQGQPQSDLGPRPGMGKSLLGDGPQELVVPGKESVDSRNKANESRSDSNWRDSESRYSRRDSRDRDRRYDDRRGRDRDERDRYRSRYDRDRERDRDRDRRRSRSRSRNRGGSRDKDRFGRDRSARDNSSRPENDSSRSTSTRKPDERPTRFLHVKNMPLTVSYRDVRRFFFPLEIPFDGLKVINDKEGNRNGEAFIYFHRLEDAVTAQKKNGDRTEGKVISIVFTTENEFTKAVDSFVPLMDKKESAPAVDKRVPVSSIPMPPEPQNTNASNKPRFIVQLNNLPQSITRQDINLFFKALKIDKEGEAAYIEFDNSGVATGKGFVEFKSDIDYKRALTHNGSLLGTSKIIVIQGNAEEADKLKAVQGEMFQRAALRNLNKTSPVQSQKPGLMGARPNAPIGPSQQAAMLLVPTAAKPANTTPSKEDLGSHDTVCVHIQGLPLLATPRDIKEFFGDSQIALRGINIAHDGQGKPLGEGFVEFKFLSDFEKALKKDKTSMGRHIVAVKPIGKKEMLDKLENAKQQGATQRTLINPTPPASVNNQSKPPMPLVQQSPQTTVKPLLAPTSSSTSQSAPQSQAQGPPDNQSSVSNNLHNQSIPRPPGPSNNPELKQSGPNPNSANPRAPGPEMGKTQGPVMPLLQTPQPQVTMPGGGKSFPPGVLNSNWYYVRCQNFPPDISIGEIMSFFKTFRPLGESIRLHYSSEGHPTGNAVVGFASGEEATRALQCLNMRVCRHNVVTLHPA